MHYYIYILESKIEKRYYVGYTSNLEVRVEEHNNSSGYKWASRYKPWKLVYFEKFSSKKEAISREKEIKRKKSRLYIDKLIGNVGR